ncbi:hypothetical protein HYPSUDRAFT_174089 [Hypholoma sublateritium FD-334 SS-4]|uniref:SMODS and SLOG-associating 2TM effector domain-containing protein n=1 Tax=Hypholoma sublateritium (strain FD-334 SS-4) TaxID=945553 RepID=A0A0D2NXV7_HYPSF|nr:hypothetical protein HYPSUDRAFT_174089 [Hypholoma sublateritium FD-334 SS-4]
MTSEDSGSGSPENRPILTRNDSETSVSRRQPPRRTSTELVLDAGVALGTGLVLGTALVLDPDNLGGNSAPPQDEQHNPGRRARIQEQPRSSDITVDSEAELFPEATPTVKTNTSLPTRRGHDRAGVRKDMPLPPLPTPVAAPEFREGGRHHGRPRSMYSPPSPTSRNPPRRSSGSPPSWSQDAHPFVSPAVAVTHDHAASALRTQQGHIQDDSAPRTRLRMQESHHGIIEHPLRQNVQSRAKFVEPEFGNTFVEDNANDDSLRDDPGDLDDPEAQHRSRIRQGKRRNIDVERPIPTVVREDDNTQRRIPGTDDAGALGAQAAGEILYSITRVDNSRPDRRQSGNTRDEIDDGVKRNRTSGTRFSRTSRSYIDDLVPVATYTGSIKDRLAATLQDAESERNKYIHQAKYTGWALNIAIGLQVLLGALTTGLSAVATRGKSSAVATTILGALATLVASYLARARGSNEPELSITRVKDLEQFIRECKNFIKDFGEDVSNKYQPIVDRFRERFEGILGNTSDERELSAGRRGSQDVSSYR